VRSTHRVGQPNAAPTRGAVEVDGVRGFGQRSLGPASFGLSRPASFTQGCCRIALPLFPIRADIDLVRIARVLLRASSLFRSFSLLGQPRTFRGKGEVFCHLSGQSCTGNAMWCGNGRVCLTLH